MPPLYFKTYQFKALKNNNFADIKNPYSLIKDVLKSFDGDAKKFCSSFYKKFSETASKNASLILAFDVANHILCHLSGSTFKGDGIEFSDTVKKISDKKSL